MRTTVEIPKDQRAALIRIASKRGWKGFSRVIQEAIEFFLRCGVDISQDEKTKKALACEGVLSETEGNELSQHVSHVRTTWR